MRIIKLTSQKNGLGFAFEDHKLVNHSYFIQDNYSVYTTIAAREEHSRLYGRYCATACLNVSNRKRAVSVMIGFDMLGNYQTSMINGGRGRFSKKVQEELFGQLIEWLIADGWAVEVKDA